jgi:hypothetical protein
MRDPLFIICPGRTFSSVICAVIGQHPEAFGLPEVNLFKAPTAGDVMAFKSKIFSQQVVTSGLRRTIAELKFGMQTVETITQADEWIAKHGHLTGGQLFGLIQDMADGRMVVDKSPTNSHEDSIARMMRDFPDAHFLHITRHPRATCNSQHKAYQSRPRFAGRSFDHHVHWLERHQNCVDLGARLGPAQYMLLHGEWFFDDPSLVLRQICEWLGLSTDDDAIDMMMRPEDGPFSWAGPENAKGGNNKGFLENPKLRVGKIKDSTLDGPLEWITDRDVDFDMKTRNFAHQLGYRG